MDEFDEDYIPHGAWLEHYGERMEEVGAEINERLKRSFDDAASSVNFLCRWCQRVELICRDEGLVIRCSTRFGIGAPTAELGPFDEETGQRLYEIGCKAANK